MRGVYTVYTKIASYAVTGPNPILMVSPGQGIPVEMIEAHVTFSSSTTNQQQEMRLADISSWNITNYSALTPRPTEHGDQAAVSIWYAWNTSTFAGTIGNYRWAEGFSTLPGWHWTPSRDGRLYVNAASSQSTNGLALVMNLTPSSIDMEVTAVFREIG